jgi:hypothetical protein
MRFSPSIVPLPDDVDVYLVLDDFGHPLGRAWRETDEEDTDRETLLLDLIEGQYSNPVRVISFNTAEGWSRDVSEDIAEDLQQLCASRDEVPHFIADFVETHGRRTSIQLSLL